jgi:hypothetical protein
MQMKNDIEVCKRPCADLVIEIVGLTDVRKLWKLFYISNDNSELQQTVLINIAQNSSSSETRWLAYRRSKKGHRSERMILEEIVKHERDPVQKNRANEILSSLAATN